MRRADGDGDELAGLRVNGLAVRGVEADGALSHEEGLVMHLVPVAWGAGGAGGDD